jgi:hypothetical protein
MPLDAVKEVCVLSGMNLELWRKKLFVHFGSKESVLKRIAYFVTWTLIKKET